MTDPAGSDGRLISGRYRLHQLLGRGGMGAVWSARDEVLGRRVAVKEVSPATHMTPEQWDEIRQRTMREARAAARLTHPCVVTVYDVVEDGGRPWIVMELLPPQTLGDIVTAEGPLRPLEAARIGLDLVDALRTAHRAGVLHRDVKPANVILSETGRAVLTDFGIASVEEDPTLTATGMLVGSPGYMSPERARGERPTAASDLWSLGATLYATVEGDPPFRRDGQLQTLYAVISEPPPPAPHAGPLKDLIAQLLDKEPARRPSTNEVRQQLLRIIDQDAPESPAPFPRRVNPVPLTPTVSLPASGEGPEEDAGAEASAGPEPSAEAAPSTGPEPSAEAEPSTGPEAGPESSPGTGPDDGERSVAPVAPVPAEATREAAPEGPALAGAAAGEEEAAPATARTPAPDTRPSTAPLAEEAPAVAKAEAPAAESPKTESPKTEPSKTEPSKTEPSKTEPPKAGPRAAAPTERETRSVPPPRTPAAGGAPGTARPGAGGPGSGLRRRPLVVAGAGVLAVAAAVGLLALRDDTDRIGTASGSDTPAATSTPSGGTPATSATGPSGSAASSGSPGATSGPPASTPAGTTAGNGADPAPGASTSPPAATGGAGVPAGFRLHQDPTGFAVAVPAGWTRSVKGTDTIFRQPGGRAYLLVAQTNRPKPDAVADWRAQESSAPSRFPGYQQIRLERVEYRDWNAADWEFTWRPAGGQLHVLNRNIRVDDRQAYALYWSVPAQDWGERQKDFEVIADSFRSAG